MVDELKINRENFIFHKTTPISKEYIMGKQLGSGSFGSVRLAIHKATKQRRAIKIQKKTKDNKELILDEISILSKLVHPNIMQIFEVFEDNTNFYIVSEHCKGGELFEEISKKGSFSEKNAAIIYFLVLSLYVLYDFDESNKFHLKFDS